MTNDEAIRRTNDLLRNFNLYGEEGWWTRVLDEETWAEWYGPENADKHGVCFHTYRQICLRESALADDEQAEHIIQHEVSHALQPPDTESHGLEFERALAHVKAEVRKMELVEISARYPDDGKLSLSYYLRHPLNEPSQSEPGETQ